MRPPTLHIPTDVRSLSLSVIAVLATIFALAWAKTIVVPLLLGLMVSYTLTPIVDRLVRWRVPRAAGSALVLLTISIALVWGGWSLRDQAESFVDSLPAISQKMRQVMRGSGAASFGTLAKVQQAAVEISKAADEGVSPNPRARVLVERPTMRIQSYLWTGTMGLLSFLGQAAVVVFVAFFLLASGNSFRRKMVKLAGPKLSQKKVTIEALDEVTGQIQRYLLVQIATSVLVGFVTWVVFLSLGLNNAGVWGVVAGFTNLIPYLGAVIISVGAAVMGLVQFDGLQPALMVGLSSFAIHSLVGNLLAPWLTGRANRTSALSVFVAVLVFGWLWGPVGLILGVPILIVIKAVCDRVEELKPIGEFLGTGGHDVAPQKARG